MFARPDVSLSVVAFRWRYQDRTGVPVEVSHARQEPAEFDDQQAAEAWFGEAWEGLRAAGVDAVVLLHDGEEVGGPMSLHES